MPTSYEIDCPSFPELVRATDRLVLREQRESDAPDANAYERLEEVARYGSGPPRSLDESLTYIREGLAHARTEPRRVYDLAITERGDDTMIGRCGFGIRAHEPREAMLWYVLHPRCHGRGYAVEAARSMVDLAFGELGLHRVYADIDPRNAASVRVAEKLGMRREGHFIENAWLKGEWTDSLIFALLEREWPARRG